MLFVLDENQNEQYAMEVDTDSILTPIVSPDVELPSKQISVQVVHQDGLALVAGMNRSCDGVV